MPNPAPYLYPPQHAFFYFLRGLAAWVLRGFRPLAAAHVHPAPVAGMSVALSLGLSLALPLGLSLILPPPATPEGRVLWPFFLLLAGGYAIYSLGVALLVFYNHRKREGFYLARLASTAGKPACTDGQQSE